MTTLALTDSLPLTCIRVGTCCHGNIVGLNPWELARLAAAKGLTSRVFRDHYCEFGGIRLRFDKPAIGNGPAVCSQYLSDSGCSAYGGRPLVCRMFPIGRKRHGEKLNYIHVGSSFPCLDGCPGVVDLPYMTVEEYLICQDTKSSETALDEYLELMHHLADGAFALLLESGLAASGDQLTLRLWCELGKEDPERLAKHLGSEWIDRLMLPEISVGLNDPVAFAHEHFEMLQIQAQKSFGNLEDDAGLRDASGLMIGLALHLGRGLGANTVELARNWILTAKELGARE